MDFDFTALGFSKEMIEAIDEDTKDYRERLPSLLRGYTKEEKSALHEKEEAPQKEVLCPRCGKELIFLRKGNSYMVKCVSRGCIMLNFRGL